MSPINNVQLRFSRAFFSGSSVSHENVQIFCRIGFAKHYFKWFTVVLMDVSYARSAALLFACCLYRSSLNIEALLDFRSLHLQLWCWLFSLWFSSMYPSNYALLRFSRAYYFVQSQSWKSSTLRGICPAKLSFKLITTLPMEVAYRQSAALLFAGLLYCSSLKVETLREFRKTTRANVTLNFSLWFSMMSPINNVLLWFARASYIVQVSVMKVFKCSVDYSLQNFVSNYSLLFWWKSPISAALLCFSLAYYIVQVSMLKLFESSGRLHVQMWRWIFLSCSQWCLL